jgi:nitric oxide reductase NorD protein
VALRALTDWRAGAQPDPRIHMSTRTDGRDIAVLLLVDLSQSVNDAVPGSGRNRADAQPRGRGAAGQRHQRRWATNWPSPAFTPTPARGALPAHQGLCRSLGRRAQGPPGRRATGAYSTRMGAALRHASQLLSGRQADKKLLLVLTDGQPADVDVADPEHLIADAAQAVREADRLGLYTHCISLDAQADAYVGPHLRWPLDGHRPRGAVAAAAAGDLSEFDALTVPGPEHGAVATRPGEETLQAADARARAGDHHPNKALGRFFQLLMPFRA